MECEFWRQKAAIRWIKEGDANTSFFHSVVQQRRNSNYVARVKDEALDWIQDTGDIQASAVWFFSALF